MSDGPLATADNDAAERAADLMQVVLDHGDPDGGGTTINLDASIGDLTAVMAWLAALRPDLDTPQRVRLFTQEIAKELAQLIPSARADHAESGMGIKVFRRDLQ